MRARETRRDGLDLVEASVSERASCDRSHGVGCMPMMERSVKEQVDDEGERGAGRDVGRARQVATATRRGSAVAGTSRTCVDRVTFSLGRTEARRGWARRGAAGVTTGSMTTVEAEFLQGEVRHPCAQPPVVDGFTPRKVGHLFPSSFPLLAPPCLVPNHPPSSKRWAAPQLRPQPDQGRKEGFCRPRRSPTGPEDSKV